MYKLMVLLSAVAAAHGGLLIPAAVSPYSTPVVTPFLYGASLLSYSPVFSQPPNSPAQLLDPVRGVPLDTPEVVAARAAHYQAKALSGYHHLRKRSVAYTAPVAYSAPVVSTYSASPAFSYSSSAAAPFATAVLPQAYGVHPY